MLGGSVAVFILLCIGLFFALYSMTPIPTASEQTANWQSSSVYFANGKQMGTFDATVNGQTVDRQLLTPGQIPSVMTQAMAAAEDRHFYTEGGVSVTGLMRAAYEDVFGSGNLQGGSTITMQYAKNYYANVNTGRNFSTKIKEIFIAMKLGHDKSKSWVMTNYLNTVPFGGTTYGLGAASENYFDVNLTNPHATLTIAQAAMLAALPNSPGFFNPDPSAGAGYTALVARWHYVLDNMVRDGNITQAQASAQKFPKLTPPPSGNGESGYTEYLMNMVEQQLEAPVSVGGYNLSQQQIDTGGYQIHTTFNPAKVNALARAVNQEKAQMRADGVPAHLYDRFSAVLEDSKTGAIVAIYGGPGVGSKHCKQTNCWINNAESAQPVGSSFKPYVLSTAVSEGMNVFTSKLNGHSPIWIPVSGPSLKTVETSLSPLSPPPGLTQSSSYGMSSNGIQYFKFDEASENVGTLPVNVAAAISSDPAFEDLAHRDGIASVIQMAKALGVGQNAFVAPCGASGYSSSISVAQTIAKCNDFSGPGYKAGGSWYPGNGLNSNFNPASKDRGAQAAGTPGSPAVALGENPLTPIEQASTFATLADDGTYHTPHVIGSLQQGGKTIASHITVTHPLSAASAADVDWALSFDNNYPGGTADATVSFRRGDVIAKTGTLGSGQNSSQAWFIGATPDQYALAVNLFTNDPGKQNLDDLPSVDGAPGSQGGGWPAATWNNFMTANYSSMPTVQLFPQVNNSLYVPWIQVQQAPPKPTCQPGQYQGCVCPQGQQCTNPNPNPTSTCQQQVFGHCVGGSPSPSPTCQGNGQPCQGPGPQPSPSISCSPTQGPPCITGGAVTTSKLLSPASASGGSPAGTSHGGLGSDLQVAEEAAVTGARALVSFLL